MIPTDPMRDLPADLDHPTARPRRTQRMIWPDAPDFAECRGKVAEVDQIAAAIRDRATLIVLWGPPGVGKTMLARRISGILPPLAAHERRWLEAEYEGMLGEPITVGERPFRAPHHTVSAGALVGVARRAVTYAPKVTRSGALIYKPGDDPHAPDGVRRHEETRAGEAQLARFGVLMLDELHEFSLAAIGALSDRLARMTGRPLIVATATRCPCGYYGNIYAGRECVCTPSARTRHDQRLGTILATLLRGTGGAAFMASVEVGPLALADLKTAPAPRNSAEIRAEIWPITSGMDAEIGGMTLTECLAMLGYTHRESAWNCREVIDSTGHVVAAGTAGDVWAWLRATHDLGGRS